MNRLLTISTLSNFNELFYPMFWIKLKRSVGVKGITPPCSQIQRRLYCNNHSNSSDVFTIEKIEEIETPKNSLKVYRLEEKYFESWNRANIFYIEGSEKNLLIDSGTGLFNLPRFLSAHFGTSFTSKPLVIFLTHIHFDHSGGLKSFVDLKKHELQIYSSKEECKFLLTKNYALRKYATASWIMKYEIGRDAPTGQERKERRDGTGREYNVEREYSVDHLNEELVNLRYVKNGDVICLGKSSSELERFQIIELPGHTSGSLGLLNQSFIVSGDALYSTNDELIDWYPVGSSVTHFNASVKRIMNAVTSCDSNVVLLPGHNDVLYGKNAIQGCGRDHLKHPRVRVVFKVFSRWRACIILWTNALFSYHYPMSDRIRRLIMK